MLARAVAAASAIKDTIEGFSPDAETRKVAAAAALAAEQAYDLVADAEQQQRDGMVSSSSADARAAERRMPVSEAVLHQRVYFSPVLCTYVGGLAMVGDGARPARLACAWRRQA
jgi:hypothetical protein